MPQGSKGEAVAFQDFGGTHENVTWASTSVDLGGEWGMVSVSEGTVNDVVDEDGGILQFLTATGDNDNVVLFAGPFKPSNGPMSFEARFKVADDIANTAVYGGFMQTLNKGTPVFPITVTGTTLTYTGTGGMVGLVWDSDRTTNAWLGAVGDGGAASNTPNYPTDGTEATDALVLDEFDIIRVELNPSGSAEIWHDEELVASGQTSLTPGDVFFAVLICENRTGAALEFEVDYVYASGVRNWTV